MAVGTFRSRGVGCVVVVLWRVVDPGLVALGADAIFFRAQLQAVGFVAIAADYTGLMHFALYERAVYVVLVENLAVVII
jgi:hypothetical protein